eukprot:scaffold104645_cov29-Tisochrysis_lutea.AAC.2
MQVGPERGGHSCSSGAHDNLDTARLKIRDPRVAKGRVRVEQRDVYRADAARNDRLIARRCRLARTTMARFEGDVARALSQLIAHPSPLRIK